MINNLIYFNNNSTTQTDERVVLAMMPYLKEDSESLFPEAAVENAISQIAGLINCHADELLFATSTQSAIEFAINRVYRNYSPKGNHIITCKTERRSVLNYCEKLKSRGAEITYLGVDKEGLIDPAELKAAIKPSTILVSVMAANNETGVIQAYEKIAEICKEHKIVFFSDASQFVGKTRTDVEEMGIDMMVFSGHKMYGPKGIAAIYTKKINEEDLQGKLAGDEQRKDFFSHEKSTSLLIGMGEAAEICQRNYWDDMSEVSKLRAYLEHHLLDLEGLQINGSTRQRLYNTSNLSFPPGKNIQSLLSRFEFADNLGEPSHVLSAMGLSTGEIKNSFRFSFGKHNTLEEVKNIVEEINQL